MSQIKVELQEFMGSDKSIAESAWTSSFDLQKKQSRTEEDVKRVVNLLADSKHSVPFESVIFKFWMRLPIAIDRQIVTHRIASHSGMSGRYRTMPDEFLQAPDDIQRLLGENSDFLMEYEYICSQANDFYNSTIKHFKELESSGKFTNKQYKRLREFFRGVLPQHNMTERVTVINLRSFSNFYSLRSKPDAQPEIQEIANKMLEVIKQSNVCPIAIECLERNGWDI